MVEQEAVNFEVASSSLASGANKKVSQTWGFFIAPRGPDENWMRGATSSAKLTNAQKFTSSIC